MSQTITAVFDGHVLRPEAPVDLEPNQRYWLTVEPAVSGESMGDAWDALERLSSTIDAPTDWSAEHNHYLYGTPVSMSTERFLLDTVFIQALLNRRDQYHNQAQAFLPRVRSATEVWITEAVLVEVGNALSAFDRVAASTFIVQCYKTANIHVVAVDTALRRRHSRCTVAAATSNGG